MVGLLAPMYCFCVGSNIFLLLLFSSSFTQSILRSCYRSWVLLCQCLWCLQGKPLSLVILVVSLIELRKNAELWALLLVLFTLEMLVLDLAGESLCCHLISPPD